MKTSKRLDREIATVEAIINRELDGKPLDSPEARVMFAVYHTLRWARGLREEQPELVVLLMAEQANSRGRGWR